MEISQQEFDQLVQQIRDLTVRVHRLEQFFPAKTQPVPADEAAPPVVAPPVVPPPPVAHSPMHSDVRPVAPAPPAFIPPAQEGPGLEARIGSHWLNRIGIAAILISVSLFLNYAFENNWIGAAGRIAIGLIAGIAVVLWSQRFRSRGYNVFSYSLRAVGIGALYLSLWASFQVYHLMPSGVVFACMLMVTAATCAMALSQNAEILAVFAITGGFATPVLLSTGVNREFALFSYVLVLDVGILALVFFKPWRRLLLLGFMGTLILYCGWYVEFYSRSQFQPTLTFATLFFAIFGVAPLLMLRQEHGSGVMPLGLAFANAVVYFLQAYAMIADISVTAMAWFSLLLAAVYLWLNRFRPRTSDPQAEQKLRLMHLALAVGLITVAIPIRLEAHWITIGWFVEAAILLWLADRIKSDLLNIFALTALVLGVGRLLFWDNFGSGHLIFNMRMAVYGVAIAVLGFVAYNASKRNDDPARTIAAVAVVAMNALALVALSHEIADYYSQQTAAIHPHPGSWSIQDWARSHSVQIARNFSYSALWMAYGAMLMVIGFRRGSAFVRWQALLLIAATIVKVFVLDTSQLDRIYRILSFVALGALLLAVSFAYQRDWLKLSSAKGRRTE